MFDYPYVLCMLYVLQLQQYFSQFIFYSKNLKTPMGKKVNREPSSADYDNLHDQQIQIIYTFGCLY